MARRLCLISHSSSPFGVWIWIGPSAELSSKALLVTLLLSANLVSPKALTEGLESLPRSQWRRLPTPNWISGLKVEGPKPL
jgi:hypothetical protein